MSDLGEVGHAAIDLIGRMGAKSLEVGYAETGDGDWWAGALWNGRKVHVDGKYVPDAALDALARRLLVGGTCAHCGKTVTIVGTRGRKHCLWKRSGKRWERGCTGPDDRRVIPTPARRGDIPDLRGAS